jgi:dipeptidyl aminopeptidase/acylaminoacyl peptidase
MGYAVLDINHRGSTGFGREFRQSLAGQWGEYDCKDIKAGIDFVVKKRWADPRLVFIRGSSAGGYAVLRALTRYPGLFSGGASYYGIGNLITLSEITHKFESRYTDQLLGECFDAIKSRRDNSRYVKRSPLFDMDKIQCPIILFQGAEDQIVPPGIAYEIIDLLKRNGIHYSYTEYPDEGHGFRKAETRIDAMERESAFFSEIIRDKISSPTISPGN